MTDINKLDTSVKIEYEDLKPDEPLTPEIISRLSDAAREKLCQLQQEEMKKLFRNRD